MRTRADGGAAVVPGVRTTRRSAWVASPARQRVWEVAVWSAMACWAIMLFAVVRERYIEFRFARYDLGNMVQAVWSTTQGRPLEWTNGATGEQASRLANHVDPILVALAPLWMVFPSPLALEAVQVVAVALGALPIFWLGRRHLASERAAAVLAVAYLAYPWISWNAVDAFHPVTLGIPLFLYCIWFLDTDRLVAFAICAVFVLMTGELMGFALAGLGLWYAWARGRTVVGLVIAVFSATWTAVALYIIVPAVSGAASVYHGAFEEVGGSPWGIARTAVTKPAVIISQVAQRTDLLYILLIGAPLAGAFLLAPVLAAVALPALAVNLLANDPGTTDPHEHYVAGILPFLFAATAVGLARLSPRGRERTAVLALCLSATASVAVGPWPRTLLGTSSWGPLPAAPEHIRALEQAVALVPDEAAVSATNRVGAHLAARRYFYSVPVLGRAEWVVLETADTWIPRAVSGGSDPTALLQFQRRIEASPAWRTVFDDDGVLVYRRVKQ